jgi:hypothetical protein
MALKPPSAASTMSTAKAATHALITLPSDLSGSLKYLDDAQLQTLQDAVVIEIKRRRESASQDEIILAQPTAASPKPAVLRSKIKEVEEISEAKENLIRASFRAGLKPVGIARTLRIPQALVNRVLGAPAKPKR